MPFYIGSTDRSSEKYLNKLSGKTEIEDALKRLEKLAQDETLMALAQLIMDIMEVKDTVNLVHLGMGSVIFSY